MEHSDYNVLYTQYGDYLTTKELAIYLKINYNTACELLKQRKILGKKIGKSWRIPRYRVVDFLNQTK